MGLEDGLVRVRRTLTRNKGRLLLGEPKTKRSRRTVRLTEAAVVALKKHFVHQMEEKNSPILSEPFKTLMRDG